MKWTAWREHIVVPMAARLGTIAATFLVSLGVDAELESQVGVVVAAVVLVMADLVIGYWNRKGYANRRAEAEKERVDGDV